MKHPHCETLFVGWDRPLLPVVVRIFNERFSKSEKLDLSHLLCVLPTARSVNRLTTLLVDQANRTGDELRLPSMITVGELPERLYRCDLPTALEFEQTLAWARVLLETHRDDLAVLIPNLPPPEPLAPWLELAATLRRLHEELASSNLSFQEVVEKAETDGEKRRWLLLADLLGKYQEELARVELVDPHLARRHAIEEKRCSTKKTIVLIGTSDMVDGLVSMLRCTRGEIISMIAAPPSAAERFNEFGCVKTDLWLKHELPIEDHHLLPASDISDQATASVEALHQWQHGHADSVNAIIGVTDSSQVGPVEMELRGAGHTTFRASGWPFFQTAVGRLLSLTASHLQSKTWQSLAALVRHAHVTAAITADLPADQSTDWLSQLDALLANHYPRRIDGELPAIATKTYPLAIAVRDWVNQRLSPFGTEVESPKKGKSKSSAPQEKRSLGQWCDFVSSWIAGVVNDSEKTQLAIAASEKLLQRFAKLNAGLDVPVSGLVAMEMLAGRLNEVRVVEPHPPEAVAVVGWLDLALDDAEALIVVGLNHPFVPASVTSDPFLPGSLRSVLRMADNDRRYARDVYAMHLMLSVRDHTRFIVGKTGADGSPTPPSRLIAAAPPRDMARRTLFLLEEKRALPSVIHDWDDGPDQTEVPIPLVPVPPVPVPTVPAPEITSQPQTRNDESPSPVVKVMSVTAFRDYLTCPYRFYLRHVLKLKPIQDEARELAANQFGDLVHGALETFGESKEKDETSAAKIEAALIHHLHDYANKHYGRDVSMAVHLQVTQAERRLKTVAVRQAERIHAGWTIHATEASVGEKSGAKVTVDEGEMGLRGRFDRIDYHQDTGKWAILDYKTHGDSPEKKHLKKSDGLLRWIDLQLPLYRMMIPFLGIDAPPHEVQLGYFNVADKEDDTKINLAKFSEELMDDANELIHECVRGVLRGYFQPTEDRVEFDDYGMILQTGIASRMLDEVQA